MAPGLHFYILICRTAVMADCDNYVWVNIYRIIAKLDVMRLKVGVLSRQSHAHELGTSPRRSPSTQLHRGGGENSNPVHLTRLLG